MGLNLNKDFDKTFAIILADGSIRTKAEEGAEGAVKRVYKDSDNVEHTKWEYKFNELTGKIIDIQLKDGDYGEQINIFFDEDNLVLSLSASMNYGSDFMKKVPNIDLSKEIKIVPFSFTNKETGKPVKGLNITQDGEKIKNFFYDEENKKNINGFPEPENVPASEKTKTYWRKYFMGVTEFLQTYITAEILPKLDKLDNQPKETEEKRTVSPEAQNAEGVPKNVEEIFHGSEEVKDEKLEF